MAQAVVGCHPCDHVGMCLHRLLPCLLIGTRGNVYDQESTLAFAIRFSGRINGGHASCIELGSVGQTEYVEDEWGDAIQCMQPGFCHFIPFDSFTKGRVIQYCSIALDHAPIATTTKGFEDKITLAVASSYPGCITQTTILQVYKCRSSIDDILSIICFCHIH